MEKETHKNGTDNRHSFVQGIDTSRSCICGACEVYHNYRLGNGEPMDHFCKNGNAR